MVQIPGKRTRLVPILILPAIRKAMDCLLEIRNTRGIAPNNKYFFATDSLDGYLSQCKVLTDVTKAANLERPELVRSTKLRKYLATVAQVCYNRYSYVYFQHTPVLYHFYLDQHTVEQTRLEPTLLLKINPPDVYYVDSTL